MYCQNPSCAEHQNAVQALREGPAGDSAIFRRYREHARTMSESRAGGYYRCPACGWSNRPTPQADIAEAVRDLTRRISALERERAVTAKKEATTHGN